MQEVLRVENLSVGYRLPFSDLPPRPAVTGFHLNLKQGEVVGVAGESGSGKSTVLLAATGYTSRAAVVTSGSSILNNTDLLTASSRELRKIWGRRISFVSQNAGTALHPSLRIGEQLADAKKASGNSAQRSRRDNEELVALLDDVGIPEPQESLSKYSYEFSGGQQQRIAIALALVGCPDVIFLDEPTTGLDVTTQAKISALLSRLIRSRGIAMVYVSHDLGLLGKIADRLIVMKDGRIVEAGLTTSVLANPSSSYARMLVAAVPDIRGHLQIRKDRATVATDVEALRASNLCIAYTRKKAVVRDVTLTLRRGEIVCLVGESGSGKSTILKSLAGLQVPASGEIRLGDGLLPPAVRSRDKESIRRIQTVFQNPDTALNPRRTIGAILQRPLTRYRPDLAPIEQSQLVRQALASVELSPDLASRFCNELSGGQRQRVSLARAIIVEPEILLCDEVTSSLDVSVQASVLKTLVDLVASRNIAMLFVTHDLGVVRAIGDRVVVLRSGSIVDQGGVEELFSSPRHGYTKELLDAVPTLPGRV